MVSHCCHSVNKETGCLRLPARKRRREKGLSGSGILWAGWLSSANRHPHRLGKKQFYRTIKSELCHPLARDTENLPYQFAAILPKPYKASPPESKDHSDTCQDASCSPEVPWSSSPKTPKLPDFSSLLSIHSISFEPSNLTKT